MRPEQWEPLPAPRPEPRRDWRPFALMLWVMLAPALLDLLGL